MEYTKADYIDADRWKTSGSQSYSRWREQKLNDSNDSAAMAGPVEIRNLDAPSAVERAELIRRCRITNGALYACSVAEGDSEKVRDQIRKFADSLGLMIAEKHRSAGRQGIVALTPSNKEGQRGYIPYSQKAMNWHTDGYYNGPAENIRAMVLHCVRPAEDGGINEFLDPEIAYIRLRDENPDYIDALMHPQAMTIPENREANGNTRPVSIGPVFSVASDTGHLEMRYTARTRSIKWRDDPMTAKAVVFLRDLLEDGDPFIQKTKLEAGHGILCNNSLHNRTGFNAISAADSARLLFRVRFHNRVSGN